MSITWIQSNVEKLVFTLGMVMVALTVALVLWDGALELEGGAGAAYRNDPALELKLGDLRRASKRLREPALWEGENLFVSVPMVETEGKLVPIDGCFPPVPGEWLVAHALLGEPDGRLLERDPDGDGFSNLEEWLGKTDPREALSRPDRITKLRLVSAVPSDLSLAFRTKVDSETWQIDLDSRAKFRRGNLLVRRGETFGPDNRFRFLSFEEKRGVGEEGVPWDRSEVVVDYPSESGDGLREHVVLVRNEVWEMPPAEGLFHDRLQRKQLRLRVGQKFLLGDQTYELIELNDVGAVVKDKGGRRHTVKLNER